MSSKLKKWIIAGVAFLVAAILVLVGITFLSGLSTATVYNLRFVELVKVEASETPEETPDEDAPSDQEGTIGDQPTETPEEPKEEYELVEVFEKDVFLTSKNENEFEVSITYSASAQVDFVTASSNSDIATIEPKGDDVYTVKYFKAGKTTISVYATENPSVYDSFVLTVRENAPVSFEIVTDPEVNKNVISEDEVFIYADDKDYSFKFDSTLGGQASDINLSGIYVIKDYNTEVFEDIYIDDANSSLVIKAKQSKLDTREYITLQSRHGGEEGEVVESFIVSVDVRGNYAINIQLCVDTTSDFKTIKNIYGKGDIKEGEEKIDAIILTSDVNIVNFKVRVVYTNGDVFYVTAAINSASSEDMKQIEIIGNEYYIVAWDTSDRENLHDATATISVSAEIGDERLTDSFIIDFYVDENSAGFKDFADRKLYKKERDAATGEIYYTYIYWDVRFMREDAIVSPENGRIIGFTKEPPTCGEPFSTSALLPSVKRRGD